MRISDWSSDVCSSDLSKDGRTLYVQRESRDQKTLDLLAVDPATGKARAILTERAKSWINLSNNFTPLKDGSFLWWSERTGHGHLYHVRGGKWTALTSGEDRKSTRLNSSH